MAQKLVISKPNYNVLTETSPDNIIFSSDYDTLKYSILGTTTLTVNFAEYYYSESAGPFGDNYYSRKVVTIAHNLGYIPFFVGYLLNYPSSGKDVQLPIYAADFTSFGAISCYADSTNIYFLYYASNLDVNSGSQTFDLKYRIFKNDLGI